jgi:hypothetical protein
VIHRSGLSTHRLTPRRERSNLPTPSRRRLIDLRHPFAVRTPVDAHAAGPACCCSASQASTALIWKRSRCPIRRAGIPSRTRNSYSARHIAIISDYVTRHGIAPDDAAAWAADLLERAQLGEYFFSLSRYIFVARKP